MNRWSGCPIFTGCRRQQKSREYFQLESIIGDDFEDDADDDMIQHSGSTGPAVLMLIYF